MNTPDMFLTKAERQEKKRRLLSQQIIVLDTSSPAKECPIDVSPSKQQLNVPSIFQKTSIRKQML